MTRLENLFNLKGKTALVTGASSGLGRRFCQVLSEAGASIVAVARRVDRLEVLKAEIEAEGGECALYGGDLVSRKDLQETLARITEDHKIDILINAAGVAGYTPLFDSQSGETFKEIFDLNVTALWDVTQQVAKHMKTHEIKGSIINIASVNGDALPASEAAAYCASKAAVIQLGKQLVGELSPYSIRINTISPGLFETEMTEALLEKSRSYFKEMIPLNFIATTEEMDGTILYLASNKASAYVSGVNLVVDGGISWRGRLRLKD